MIRPDDEELREARRRLSSGTSEDAIQAFAQRQVAARRRLFLLLDFYRSFPCRMAPVHILGTGSLTLARFYGRSETLERIAQNILPVTQTGEPRTTAWRLYADACRSNRPVAVRDEFWLAAHLEDMAAVQQLGWEEGLAAEAVEGDSDWDLIRSHVEITLGSRRGESAARGGESAYESAAAASMRIVASRLPKYGRRLVRRWLRESLRALFGRHEPERDGEVTYRRAALAMLRAVLGARGAVAVYRRGLRLQDRGRTAEGDDAWPLLAAVLGERVADIHPLVVRFYENPARFDVVASLHLHTAPSRLYARLAASLVGQGLYERHLDSIPARLRVFQRGDGSMHFVRELYCDGELRLFDSDFVVRSIDGSPAFVEVFGDVGCAVVLDVAPLPDGGLLLRGRHLYWHGLRVPHLGPQIVFQTCPVPEDDKGHAPGLRLQTDGYLRMEPRTGWGRFLAFRILRRPELLGSIHYQIRERGGATGH